MRNTFSAIAAAAVLLAGTPGLALAQGYRPAGNVGNSYQPPNAVGGHEGPVPPGGQYYSGGYTGNTQPDNGYPGH